MAAVGHLFALDFGEECLEHIIISGVSGGYHCVAVRSGPGGRGAFLWHCPGSP